MQSIAEDDHLKIIRLSLGPYGTNTYVVICRKTGESVIVDAPGDPDALKTALKGTTPKYILMTHNHMDHTGSLTQLKADLKIPVLAHAADGPGLPISPDGELKDQDLIQVGNLTLRVIHTPGHTPGSLCFFHGKYLISGDTLFPGGPGKTWSSEAFKQIISCLTEKIFTLPKDTRAFPGHGDPAMVDQEREKYEAFAAKGVKPDLYGDVSWG